MTAEHAPAAPDVVMVARKMLGWKMEEETGTLWLSLT